MPTQPPASEITAKNVRAQCARILASEIFTRAKRHSAFLDYVVTAELSGRSDQVKEYSLGLDVFEKGPSFDPKTDSIVRVEASRLRSKLREYYADEGFDDPIVIEIPKGHYVPVFHSVGSTRVDTKAERKPRSFAISKINLAASAFAIAAIAWLAIDQYLPDRHESKDIAADALVSSSRADRVEKSIAVLPFRNLSAVADDVYFADGIHDDLLTQLSKLSFLEKVISRTSVEQYRGTSKTVPMIGAELGVATVLEGSVQRAGNRVRINAQLINAELDRHLWSETYDRELTTSNLFAIQSEISMSIANELHATLSTSDTRTLASVPTENLQAYELYQQAQRIRKTLGLGSRPEVAELLEEAVSLDPSFALAYVRLSRAYIDRYFTSEQDVLHRTSAGIAIDKAAELIPDMPETHIALADYYYKGFLDYEKALDQLNLAIPLAPGNAEAYALRAFILRRLGNIEEAIPDLERAIVLDPGNFSPYYVLADTYVILGSYEQSIDYYDKAITLAPNNFGLKILKAYALTSLNAESPAMRELTQNPAFVGPSGAVEIFYRWEIAMIERDYDLAMNVIASHQSESVIRRTAYFPLNLMRALTEMTLGDRSIAPALFESAIDVLERAARGSPDDPRIHSALSFAYAGLGMRSDAIGAANIAYNLYPVSGDAVDGSIYVLNFARAYAILGEQDAAIDKIQELLSRPSNWYATLNIVRRDPFFASMHDHPRFRSLFE